MCMICAEATGAAVLALSGWRLWLYYIQNIWRKRG